MMADSYELNSCDAVANAYDAGRDAANDIAEAIVDHVYDMEWTPGDVASLLESLEAGHPEARDYLPPRPSMWDSDWIALAAGLDDPSVTDPEPDEPTLTPEDEADCFRAFKQGFEDTYEDACATNLREWLNDLYYEEDYND